MTYYLTPWQGVDYPVKWTASGWDFEAAGLEDCIAEDWSRGKPVLNTEFGYQYEPGYETEPGLCDTPGPSTVHGEKESLEDRNGGRVLCRRFCRARPCLATGRSDDVNNFRPAALETLYDFFTTKTKYWRLSPHLELVSSHNALLALPGVEYVAYFPRGGTNSINLEAGSYRVQWLHPASGEYFDRPSITVSAGSREFIPPQDPQDDWVLHLINSN